MGAALWTGIAKDEVYDVSWRNPRRSREGSGKLDTIKRRRNLGVPGADTHSCWPRRSRHGIDYNGAVCSAASKSRTSPLQCFGRSGVRPDGLDHPRRPGLTTSGPRQRLVKFGDRTHSVWRDQSQYISYGPARLPPPYGLARRRTRGHRMAPPHAQPIPAQPQRTRFCTTYEFWADYRDGTSTRKFQAWFWRNKRLARSGGGPTAGLLTLPVIRYAIFRIFPREPNPNGGPI